MRHFNTENRTFGELLRFYRLRAGLQQKELAEALEISRASTISDWESGRHLPSKSLTLLGKIAEVLELNADEMLRLQEATAVALEPVQQPRKAPPRLRFVPPLPDHAIERALTAPLSDALIQRTATGTAQYTVVILSGLAGIGKATLAKQILANPAVQMTFPAGALWLRWSSYPTETDFEGWCNALGVERIYRQSWRDAWFDWLKDSGNAALLVIDDVSGTELRRSWLGELLKALPECSAALITTQDGDAVTAEVQHWLPPSRTQSFVLSGLSTVEARALATTVLGRPPTAEEWESLQDISAALGGHPEGIRLAVSTPAALQDTAASLTAETLPAQIITLLEAQWARLSRVEQEQLSLLVSQIKVSGVFGRGYAAAVWQVTPEQAQRQLERLAGMGLIERVAEIYDPLWPWPADYRVMPAVQRFLKPQVWSRKDTALDLLRAAPAVLRTVRHLRRYGGAWLRPPWQFRLVAFVWQLFLVPKVLILGLLRLAQALGAPRCWFETWRDWTILLVAERLMRRRWAEHRIEPPEEFWLFYDAHQGSQLWISLALLPAGMIGAILGLFTISLITRYPLVAQLLYQLELVLLWATLALTVGYFWSMPWRYWVVCHYGVMTWDLRLLLRLTKLLGGRQVE